MKREQAVSWLPIDSRLMTPLLSFGHVRGIAKIFLVMEMILAIGVVTGSLLLVIVSLMY